METKNSDKPTTSKDAHAHNLHGQGSPTFIKIISSPSSLNNMASTKHTPSPTSSSTNAPTLGQIGKQGSINFRHSYLSDSDADDQTFLLRTPSTRSHKYIIIPANSSVDKKDKKFPSALSTTSLTSLQKLPLRSPTSQNLSELVATPYTTSTPLTASSKTTINKFDAQSQSQPQTPTSSSLLSLSRSDVIHHHSNVLNDSKGVKTAIATTTALPNANTSVKFTIEDYESDNATDATTTTTTTTTTLTAVAATKTNAPTNITTSSSSPLDGLYSFNMPAITSIYSSASNNNNFTLPSQSSSRQLLLSSSSTTSVAQSSTATVLSHAKYPPSPSVRPVSALLATSSFNHNNNFNSGIVSANGAPSLGSGLRPSYDRNSSMRSVISAYLSDPNELTINSFMQQDGGDPSSYLYRDSVANQIYSDVTSIRSFASIGIGSSDGRRLVIKRVPQTPTELLNIVNPPPPKLPGIDDDDDDSLMDMSDETSNLKPRKQYWGSKMQFVLACIGYSVGLGNVWRFPYMCYKSGGGVFLVPYCIILVVCSIPLLFMELSIGQYTGRGPIGALGQLCPLFKGAGLASVVVSFLMSTYYSVLIGYSIYYFFTAFKTDQPWVDCNNRWNTPDCWVPQRLTGNISVPATSRTPSEEFFQNKVLQISPGIEYPGDMRWDLFACLMCAWLMVYFATWKSIKSSAKVRYFTATFPFVLIIILMGRAVTLEGANDGLAYFFRPNWCELKHANVWINAASQNFNSLGITFGSMISFASYNKYNNNIVRDTVAVSVVNVITSLLVGIFAFATLGNLALEQNTNVRDVISDGPGLIFVVYPQALAKMPYTQLWAVMFFFMLLCLGLNSQFAIVEVVVTSIQDGFPNWIKKHLGYHEIVVLIVCVISFLFGLPNIIQGGIYFFQLMDHYAASVTIMFLAFCQMIAIAWFYGTGRLSKNVKQMTGKAPSLYLKSCWIVFGPCLLFAIWVLSLINYKEPTYHNGRYTYPDWAYGVGWMFASFSLICIPYYALINLWKAQGSSLQERFQVALRPNIYECKICGEHHCEHDYPEQEQFMLTQELSGVYKPTTPTTIHSHSQPTFPINVRQKTNYNPMHLQQQKPPTSAFQQEYVYEKKFPSAAEEQPITTSSR